MSEKPQYHCPLHGPQHKGMVAQFIVYDGQTGGEKTVKRHYCTVCALQEMDNKLRQLEPYNEGSGSA